MIYLYQKNSKISASIYDSLMNNLPEWKKDKINKLVFEHSRIDSAIGYYLLRYALIKEYGINKDISFSYGCYGKPQISEYPEIGFNISHCNEAVVCVLNYGAVGIDIQDFVECDYKFRKRVLHNDEYSLLLKNQNESLVFLYWSLKEAYLKNLGTGFCSGIPINTLNFCNAISDSFFQYDKDTKNGIYQKEYEMQRSIYDYL